MPARLGQHRRDHAIGRALDQVPDERLADAVAQHDEPLDAEMVHQADMVVGEGVPRPVGLQRPARLAGDRVAQVGRDGAEGVAEFLGCVERMGGVEPGDGRVETAARDHHQRETGAPLLVVDANRTLFIERHG